MAGDELRLPGLEQVERIGAGGFGTVYRAWQAEFGRWVAVKVMADALGGADDHRRFDRERIATGSLSAHPSIVTVHDHGATEEGRPYIVMELFEGGSLADRIASEGPLPPEVVLEVGVGLAGALAAAHAGEVLHRDVKPENVLFSGYGTAALADFGIARLPGATATRSGVITASLSHAPPEVLNGDDPTPATDVYGLASTLWTAAVGRAPFQRGGDEPIAALVARIVTAPPPDAEAHGIPSELAAVLSRGLAKDPADRPGSAAAFGHELRAVQEQLGLAVTPLVLGSPAAGAAASGGATGGAGDEITRPRQAAPRQASAMSGRRRTVAALAAVLVVAGAAGAWALNGSRGGEAVVAAPSEGDDGALDASPRSRASATPSAGDRSESSPSPSADDVLAGGIADRDGGSSASGSGSGSSGGSGGAAGDGGTSSGGGTSTNEPTSVTSPTPTTTTSPTATSTDPDPSPGATTPSPSSSPTQPNRAPAAAYVTRVATAGSEVITFDGSSSSDPDGDSLTYTWTFNDGTSSKTGQTITKTFTINDDNTSSRWTVTLTVTDAAGAKDSVDVPTSVVMPTLYKMNSRPAFRAVRGAGLNPFYSPAWNDEVAFNAYDIWSQWPAAGTSVPGDTNVRIVVWEEDTCVSNPDEQHAHWWCYEDPPPSPTLDRSYL